MFVKRSLSISGDRSIAKTKSRASAKAWVMFWKTPGYPPHWQGQAEDYVCVSLCNYIEVWNFALHDRMRAGKLRWTSFDANAPQPRGLGKGGWSQQSDLFCENFPIVPSQLCLMFVIAKGDVALRSGHEKSPSNRHLAGPRSLKWDTWEARDFKIPVDSTVDYTKLACKIWTLRLAPGVHRCGDKYRSIWMTLKSRTRCCCSMGAKLALPFHPRSNHQIQTNWFVDEKVEIIHWRAWSYSGRWMNGSVLTLKSTFVIQTRVVV